MLDKSTFLFAGAALKKPLSHDNILPHKHQIVNSFLQKKNFFIFFEKTIDNLVFVWYNKDNEREVITMRETRYINGKAYTIRFCNGIHIVECDGQKVFEGWYERCKEYVDDAETSYLESLI